MLCRFMPEYDSNLTVAQLTEHPLLGVLLAFCLAKSYHDGCGSANEAQVHLKFASSYASAHLPLPPQPTLAAWADSSLVRSIHFCSLPCRYPARCCDHLPRPRCRLLPMEALSVQDADQDVFRTRAGHTSSREHEVQRNTSKGSKRRASLDLVLFGVQGESESESCCVDTTTRTTRTWRLTLWNIDPSDRHAQTSVY